ncbi:MAG: hypothetical protein GY870_20195 [archaeon]|nr:hypothetical protein [archaeon]
MGRTVPAFRPALEGEISSWDNFKRGLRPEEREIFNTLSGYARIHADAGSLAARPELTQVMFFSMFLEQQKQIESLVKQVDELERKENQRSKEN